METFLALAGWALLFVGLSFVFHGPPSLITVNKYYDEADTEETEE